MSSSQSIGVRYMKRIKNPFVGSQWIFTATSISLIKLTGQTEQNSPGDLGRLQSFLGDMW